MASRLKKIGSDTVSEAFSGVDLVMFAKSHASRMRMATRTIRKEKSEKCQSALGSFPRERVIFLSDEGIKLFMSFIALCIE